MNKKHIIMVVVIFVIISLTLPGCNSPLFSRISRPVIQPSSTEQNSMISSTTENMVEIMEQVDLFLNNEFPYTDQEIEQNMFRYDSWQGDIKLGVMVVTAGEYGATQVQGVLLGNIETEEGVVAILRFDNLDGNRFVSPIEIYDLIYGYQNSPETVTGFVNFPSSRNLHISSNSQLIISREEMIDFLNERQGEILGFQLIASPYPEYSDEIGNELRNSGYLNPEIYYPVFWNLSENTYLQARNLILELWHSSPENYGPSIEPIAEFGTQTEDPVMIDSLDDLRQISEGNFLLVSTLASLSQH